MTMNMEVIHVVEIFCNIALSNVSDIIYISSYRGMRLFTVTVEFGHIAGAIVAFRALDARHIRVRGGRLSVHPSPGLGIRG